MAIRRPNRKHSIIDGLPPELKDTVEQMLLANETYSSIAAYLAENGTTISLASISRYARNYLAGVEQMRIAQENFARLNEEMNRVPGQDMTGVLSKLAAHHMFNAMMEAPADYWQSMSADKFMRQLNGLIRAMAYSQHVDLKNKATVDAALDGAQELFFDTVYKKRPDLYAEVMQVLQQEVKKEAAP